MIIAIILIKYKPIYSINILGEEIGYTQNKQNFTDIVNKEILESNVQNMQIISTDIKPEYKLKLINRDETISDSVALAYLKQNAKVTYKFYEVTLGDKAKSCVDSLDKATKIVEKIKENHPGDDNDLNIQIVERYTENKDEVDIDSIEVAQENLQKEINNHSRQKKENAIANIKGVKIATKPVSGIITSRYGEGSRRRVSSHTGLDIACKVGTSIKVIADGTVTFANYKGSYGNLVKVNHGDNVETWYAHCNKIYTSVGAKVKAGDVISAVGSTGNSTGAHLHLEIRINGEPVNPQKYFYK